MIKDNLRNNRPAISTDVIFGGQKLDPNNGALMTPIYANSTFIQSEPGVHQGMEYGRGDNPTRHALERCVALLEGGEDARGLGFASGLAATDTVLSLLESGDHVIAMDDLYGGTRRLFEQVRKKTSGLNFSYRNFSETSELDDLVTEKTKMIWLETPTNPMLRLVDLEVVIQNAKKHDLIVVVDNTFASPVVQRPLEWGADIVVHSLTKYLNGHSDMIGGLVVIRDGLDEIYDRLAYLLNAIGAVLGPFDAFLCLRGIKTLDVRVQRACDNAEKIVKFLSGHPKVKTIYYPGLESNKEQYTIAKKQMDRFGAMVSLDLDTDLDGAKRFLSTTKCFTLAESLGGVESLIEHPAIMTHASVPADVRAELGIHDGFVRLSVGIEDANDLINDLQQALEVI